MRLIAIITAFAFVPIICLGQKQKRVYLKPADKGAARNEVYIENNRQAKEYGWITKYEGVSYPKEYKAGIKTIKGKSHKPLPKFDLKGLAKNWRALKFYKGKYYVYKPCDFCDNYIREFNDSTSFESGCEVMPAVLLSVNKINNNTYKITRKWTFGGVVTTTIHIVDQKRGIAVFEDVSKENTEITLMVPVENIRQFPIVINNCPLEKAGEWEFEKPDFAKLIAGKIKIN